MKAVDEIKEILDKYNISIDLVYDVGMSNPHMELTYEDEAGQHIIFDHYWEGRIKAYNLVPKGE